MKLKDKGLTVKDLMSLQWEDINKMGLKELKQATRALGDVIHKREQTLKKHPETAGWQRASEQLARSGGEISTKGKSYNELKKEFSRAHNYLSSKTGSLKGVQQIEKSINEKMDAASSGSVKWQDLSDEQKSKFYKLRDRLGLGSQPTEAATNQLMKMAKSSASYRSDKVLRNVFTKGEQKIYEQMELAAAQTTSDFFGERENYDWTDSDVEDFPF